MATGTGRGESLGIWFFVGLMTLLYGIVLLPYGVYAWFGNHEAQTALHRLHPTFWWGLLLTLFGAFYVVRFRPSRTAKDDLTLKPGPPGQNTYIRNSSPSLRP